MAATVVKLIDSAVATGGGTVFNMMRHSRNNPTNVGVVQFEITGTATATLEGRLDPLAPWVTVATFSASGAQSIAQFAQMRANVTAWTNGVVNGWLAE